MFFKITLLSVTSIAVLFLLAVLFFLFRMMYVKEKTDILETKENILRIGFALFIHIIYFLLISFPLLDGVFYFIKSGNICADSLLFLISIFPTIYLIYSYMSINKYFKRKYKLKIPQKEFCKIDNENTKLDIGRLSDVMQLKTKLKVLFSSYKDFPPFVFGKTTKKSYICFPANWSEILKKISEKKEKVEQYLEKFVILHEFSHIKHRDHIFVGTSFLFLRSFKFWIVSIILLISIDSFFFGNISNNIPEEPIFLGIVYYFVLFLLTRAVSKNREFIADTTASLLMPEEELESITKNQVIISGKKISYLESLLHWFSNAPKHNAIAIGIATTDSKLFKFIESLTVKRGKTKIMDGIPNLARNFFATHPKKENRRKRLLTKNIIEDRNPTIPTRGTVVWIGIILAIYSSIPIFVESDTLEILSVPLVNLGSKTFNLYTFFKIFIVFHILLSFYVFLDKSYRKISVRKYIWSLTDRHLIMFLVFSFTDLFLTLIRYRQLVQGYQGYTSYAIFITFRDSFLLFLLAFFCSVSFFLIHNYFISMNLYNKSISELKRNLVGGILKILFVLISFIFFLLIGLSGQSVILGYFMALPILFYFNDKFPIAISGSQCWGILSIKNIFVKSEKKMIGSISFLWFFAFLLIPEFIFAAIANEMVKDMRIFLIILLLSQCLILLVFLKFRKSFLPSYGEICAFLESMKKYLYLSKIFHTQKIQEERYKIVKIVNGFKLKNHSFKFHTRISIGCADSAYNAISALFYISAANLYKKSAEWLFSLENTGGGFSPIIGLKSRLISTYEAIYILKKFGMIKKINTVSHSEWIKSLQMANGFFDDSITKFPKIEKTYYALNSLSILGTLEEINKKSCTDWICQFLGEWKKIPSSVFFSLKCLELLGELTEELKREIRDDWLFPNAVFLKSLNVDKALSSFYYFFQVAEIVCDNKDEIKNLVPDLDKKVVDSFAYYLGSR